LTNYNGILTKGRFLTLSSDVIFDIMYYLHDVSVKLGMSK